MHPQSYIFSKISVSTNAIQLKSNQQRLLRQSYQQNIKPHDSHHNQSLLQNINNNLSSSNTFTSSPTKNNPNSSQSFLSRADSLPRLRNHNEQIIKNSLSSSLMNQIIQKEQFKKAQRDQQLEREREMVKYNKTIQEKEMLKQRNFIHNFQQQAIQNTHLQQAKKYQQKSMQQLQKNQFDHQYRNGNEIIQMKMQGAMENLNRSYSRACESPMTMSEYSLNSEIAIYPTKSVHRPSYEEASELRTILKETLLQQMKLNSQKKMYEKMQKINTPFVEQKFKRFDNTIVNPVDMKIAKDNPYLMKELLGRKVQQQRKTETNPEDNVNTKINPSGTKQPPASNQPSYLSRRGSNSLSKLAY